MAKTSKTHTDTDTNANSGGEDIVALKAELETLRASHATTTTALQHERARARDAELKTMSADERAIVSAQEACDATITSLEGELSSYEDQIAGLADEPGHGREIAGLNRKMAAAAAKLESEGQRKTILANQRERVTQTHKQARETAPAPTGKQMANGVEIEKLSPKTQAFLAKHPKVFSDVRFANLAVNAAQRALNVENMADDSDDYFDFIADQLGGTTRSARTEDEGDGEEPVATGRASREPGEDLGASDYQAKAPQPRAAGPGSMSAAPPTRSAPTGGVSSSRGGKIMLTAEEREVALSLYPHIKSDADKLAAYAKGKVYMADRNNEHFRTN